MPEAKLGRGTSQAYQLVGEVTPYQAGDAWWGPEIEKVRHLILRGQFAATVAKLLQPIDEQSLI